MIKRQIFSERTSAYTVSSLSPSTSGCPSIPLSSLSAYALELLIFICVSSHIFPSIFRLRTCLLTDGPTYASTSSSIQQAFLPSNLSSLSSPHLPIWQSLSPGLQGPWMLQALVCETCFKHWISSCHDNQSSLRLPSKIASWHFNVLRSYKYGARPPSNEIQAVSLSLSMFQVPRHRNPRFRREIMFVGRAKDLCVKMAPFATASVSSEIMLQNAKMLRLSLKCILVNLL